MSSSAPAALPHDEHVQLYYDVLTRAVRKTGDAAAVAAADSPPIAVAKVVGRGKALIATRAIRAEECVWLEEPLVSLAVQSPSKQGIVRTCERCHRFIGSVMDQVDSAMRVRVPAVLADALPDAVAAAMNAEYADVFPPLPAASRTPPAMDADDAHLTSIVPCVHACGEEYCSERCRDAAYVRHHWLLCTHYPRGAADGGEEDINAAALLRKQASMTHEVLLLAARGMGRVMEAWLHTRTRVGDMDAVALALRPFAVMHSCAWWSLEAAREEGQAAKAAADGFVDEASAHSSAAAAGGDADTEWRAALQARLQEWNEDALSILRTLVRSRVRTFAAFCDAARAAADVAHKQMWPIVPQEVPAPVLDAMFAPIVMEQIITASELNSIEMRIESPLHDYFRALHHVCVSARERKAPAAVKAQAKAACAFWEPLFEHVAAAADARAHMRARIRTMLTDTDEDDGHEVHAHDHADGHHDGCDEGDEHAGGDDDDDGDTSSSSSRESEDGGAADGASPFAHHAVRHMFSISKGTALFAIISTMNHSCEPNVHVSYVGGDHMGAIIAKRDIAVGEELCINYVGIKQSLAARRAELLHYGFTCTCARCVKEEGAAGKRTSGKSTAVGAAAASSA